MKNLAIPIIDLTTVQNEVENVLENTEWISTAEKIREGLGTVGFLYLINHGIPQNVISQAFEQGEKFFRLPKERKQFYKKDTSENKIISYEEFSGYSDPGSERLTPEDKYEIKELFDWTINANSQYPTADVPEFKEKMQQLDRECGFLLKKFLRLLAMALKLDDIDFFLRRCQHFDEPLKHQGMDIGRIVHYPPVLQNDAEISDGAVRCGEHSDYMLITLLFQDNAGGLEVKTVDGNWISAVPIPGTILVNTGDLTEFWTSGIFPATLHRVVIPATNDKKRGESRYSIAYFCGLDSNTMITPMNLEKMPAELKRLEKNGKTYVNKPLATYDHVMRRIATQYGLKTWK